MEWKETTIDVLCCLKLVFLVFLPTDLRNPDRAVILADDLQDWASAGFYLGTERAHRKRPHSSSSCQTQSA